MVKCVRVFLLGMVFLAAGAVVAQPHSNVFKVDSGHNYVQLPSSPSLAFTGGSFTFEAWVSVTDLSGCSSLAGNQWQMAQWIGVCGTLLRSYLSGSGSAYTIGEVPANNWTHVAVTYDAATKLHKHYIDGELAGQRTWDAGLTAPGAPWRIFSDEVWEFTPQGSIDEVRFWNVARTQAQIREQINKQPRSGTGLVAVYWFEGDSNDAGPNLLHASRVGSGGVYQPHPSSSGCVTSATQLCVGPGGRFGISATFNSGGTNHQIAKVVTSLTTPESGLFWFFGADNWEVMVKVLDGCSINSNKWLYAAATTDQHFELAFTDHVRGRTRRYFNYAGERAPAVTDVEALATCP